MRGCARAAALLPLLLGAGGCGTVELLDPTALDVDLVGLSIEATMQGVGATGGRLDFHAYAYGYHDQGDDTYLRYLDAGEMRVAGRRAERAYTRPGEPEYAWNGTVDGEATSLPVEVGGSMQVPPCTLALEFPVAPLPPAGTAVVRGRDLVLPLAFAPASLRSSHQISAHLHVTGGVGLSRTTVALTRDHVREALVVPGGLLAGLPPGPAQLMLRMEWRHASPTPPGATPCAPTLTVRTAYQASRAIRLE